MTLDELWEELKKDPECKATIEEADKTYKLLKKMENLIISDLEAKLAKAQKTMEIQRMSNDALIDENLDYRYDITDNAYEQAKYMAESWEEDYQQEIAELKQQLAEKEKEIERVKQKQTNYYRFGENVKKVTIKTIDGKNFDVYNDGYQDKISFAVEMLEKVLDTTENILDDAVKNSSLNQSYYDRLLDEVDNQIKQLKEQK